MDIASIKPVDYSSVPTSGPEVAERRVLMSATRSVNASGLLGKNQLVFAVDAQTRRPIIRVEDRETHEVVMQLPAEYVLRLAKELPSNSSQTMHFAADA